MLENPQLTIDGAILRGWRVTDAPRLVEAWTDPDIARWNGVPPDPSLDEAVRWISGVENRLVRNLSIDLVIDTERHGVVGEVGLSGFSALDAEPRGALIGYWLLPSARGQGLAHRSVHTVLEWAHTSGGLDVIVARCSPDNTASHAVAKSAGCAFEAIDSDGNQLWRSHRNNRANNSRHLA